jgi:hypothetical protein
MYYSDLHLIEFLSSDDVCEDVMVWVTTPLHVAIALKMNATVTCVQTTPQFCLCFFWGFDF